MNKTLAITLAAITLCIGIGIGFALTPEYARMVEEKNTGSMELGRTDKYLDLRYVDGMIAHHLNAINLAKQAIAQSKRKEITDLAQAIITADEQGIVSLYSNKKAWYGNTKNVTVYQKTNLGQSDATFDLRFLNALIAHHDEAILVARDVMGKSTRTEVLTLADNVIDSLTKSKVQLLEWRSQWYSI